MRRSEFLKACLGTAACTALPWRSWGEEMQPLSESPVTIESGEYEVNAHFVNSGPGFGNRLALTFDDGPSPGVTDRVLEELAKRNLRATFFMIGSKVAAYKSLAKEVFDAGHELANHTYTHPKLSSLSSERVTQELQKTQDILAEITGRVPNWFRPPYGAFNREGQGSIPRGKDLGVAYWSVDPRDWAQPGVRSIVEHIAKNAKPGSIILLHDLHRQTADATGEVLDRLEDKAYRLTQLSRFLGKPYHGKSMMAKAS
jgi:peptidoglycan/xylan/chitin deacetylase (PgdA/CDA1 family)